MKACNKLEKKKAAFWNFLPSPIPLPSQASFCLQGFPIIQSCLAPFSSPAPPLRAARLHSSAKHHSPCAMWDFEWSVLRHYNAVTLSGHQSDLSLPCSKRAASPDFPFPRSLTLSLLELFKTLHGPTLPSTCHHMQLPQTRLFFLSMLWNSLFLRPWVIISHFSLLCFQTGEVPQAINIVRLPLSLEPKPALPHHLS